MYKFYVLASSDIASGAGIEIVFRTFADFYHSLTPKHRKKNKLVFVDKGGYALPALQWAEQLNIKTSVQVLNWKRIELVNKAYEEATLLFVPSKKEVREVIIDSLSKGIPIISYQEEEQVPFINHTCGTLIDYYSKEQSIDDFVKVMRILYFDPEACKLLQKGALDRYNNLLNDGSIKESLTSSVAL